MQTLVVTVVYSPGLRQVLEQRMVVPADSTLGEALQASQLLAGVPQSDMLQLEFGIWGRKAQTFHTLQADDRIEVYRPLRVDPKSARRTRFAHQGSSKSAGLFAKRRPKPDNPDNPDA
ncbi:MAG: RnfH family protein [Rhodoferax sp.]|nr:RnfH family protein [Rhodoferax sp.]